MSTIPSTQPDQRILLAEDDNASRAFLADNLTADGYHVDVAEDRDRALARLRVAEVDLIVVDVNGTTLSLIDWVRTADRSLCAIANDTPVIVLTSQIDDVHRVRLLERGSDDVVLKPFSYPELRARIAAVLRRTGPRQPAVIRRAGPVRIDLRSRQVTVGEQAVELSDTEYRLLCQLATEPTRVFTRQELMRDIWGYTAPLTRTLDSHASRMRRKLAQAGAPDMIATVWAVGYRLNPSP